ncbi:MAG: response regulator [Chromatiales bacterium]|nr:response regulator [Chromatiales bacterium]
MKNTFLQHLPERLVGIERDWQVAKNGNSDGQHLERLLNRIQDLVGASGRAGLIDISENAFAIENGLNQILSTPNWNDNTQTATVDQLLKKLREQVNNSVSSQFSSDINTADKLAFFLRSGDEQVPGLTAALEGQGFSVIPFIHPNDVEGELQKRAPSLLIFEGIFLNQMASVNREKGLQEEANKRPIPTICLSTSKKLEQRLQALRTGVDAYFLPPFALPRIMDKVEQLTSPKSAPYRILIIEDDPSQATFAASILEKGGMKTLAITEPLKALDALNSFRPDLILMDLYMPEADGKELTTIIREHPDFVATPIVFLSGEHDTDKKLYALSAGGDDFLTKPIRPKHLISTIFNRVQRAKALQTSSTNTTGSVDSPTSKHFFYELIESLITEGNSGDDAGGVLSINFKPQKNQPEFTRQQAIYIQSAIRTLANGVTRKQDVATDLENGIGILAAKTGATNLLAIASNIQKVIHHHYFSHEGRELKLTTSIGICLFDSDITDPPQMIDRAITAAEEAAKGGGEQILIFDQALGEADQANGQENLVALLESAIKEDNFQIAFQPLNGKTDTGLETSDLMLRLRHGRQLIPKSEWRQAALERGLITDIDRLSALHALSAIENKRYEGKQISLFVEQSFQSMQDLSYIEWLRRQLRIRQMVGTGLVFEYGIAELGQDLKAAKQFIKELQEMGIGISLARFGGNTASMRVLQFLEVNYVRFAVPILKKDRETAEKLVRDIHILGTKIVLPRVSNPQLIPDHWLTLVDLKP